jgi:hypothetical protein
MINPVSSATHAQAASKPAARATAQATAQPAAQAKPQPAHTDTVQISAAALALKEAIENPVQTAREAAAGDAQAKRLLAREAAHKTL